MNPYTLVRARLRVGVQTAATELQETFGLSFDAAMNVIEFVEDLNAGPVPKPPKRDGPVMQPGRRAEIIGAAQAKNIERVKW